MSALPARLRFLVPPSPGLLSGLLLLLATAPLAAQGLDTIPILEESADRVTLLDRSGVTVVTADLPATPTVAARGPDGTLWIGTVAPTLLVPVDVAGAVGAPIPLASAPGGVAIDAALRVWVSFPADDAVTVFDAGGNAVATYPVGDAPQGVAIDGAGNCWVANVGSSSLSRVTPFGLVFNLPVGAAPYGIVALPGSGAAFSDPVGNTVQTVTVNGVVTSVTAVDLTPQGLSVDGDGALWVACQGGDTVWRLAASGTSIFAVGSDPIGVTIDGKGRAWVASPGSAEVHRIDPSTGTATPYGGFQGPRIFGDASGFSHALVVDPGADIDGDGVASGVEIGHACNPFDPVLPEIGRASLHQASVEGGATLALEGCGFLGLAAPALTIGPHLASAVTVLSDSALEATLPAAPVGGPHPLVLLDGAMVAAVFDAGFRFLRNPGQAWLDDGSGLGAQRLPVLASGATGPFAPATSFGWRPGGLAVDGDGGVWATELAGDRLGRWTADGVPTDALQIPGAVLGGVAVDPAGGAWVADLGTDVLPGSAVYRVARGGPLEGPFAVGAAPGDIAVAASGTVFVACRGDATIHVLAGDGTPLEVIPVAAEPRGLAAAPDGDVWVAAGDGSALRLRPGAGVIDAVPLGADPRGVAVAADGRVWVTLRGDDLVARLESDGTLLGVFPTATAPAGIAIDGAAAIWVTHEGASVVHRYDRFGTLLEVIALGTGAVQIGDFTGLVPVALHDPSDDHDGDAICNASELYHGSDPFRPESSAAIPYSFAAIAPAEGFQQGGETVTISGCGFLAATDLAILLGTDPLTDLQVIDDTTVTGITPAAAGPGSVTLIVDAAEGSFLVASAYRYLVSPVGSVTCIQTGIPVTIAWSEPQLYDTVQVLRDGTLLATVPGGTGTFTDTAPTLGPTAYALIGQQSGEDGPAVGCTIDVALVPPVDATCVQQGGDGVLAWVNGDVYDGVDVLRDGTIIAELPGSSTGYVDVVPPLGTLVYEVRGRRDGVESAGAVCTLDFEILPVEDLVCGANFDGATLAWSNPFPYTLLRIRRDGDLIAELPGDTTSFDDGAAEEGPHDYTVAGVLGDVEGPALTCSVTVPVLPVTDLVCSSFVFDVHLEWQNGIDDYDAIRIARDGVEIAVLPGSATSHGDPGLPLGSYLYEVTGEKNATLAEPTPCTVEVIGPIFIRGDATGDAVIGLEDAIFLLLYVTGAGEVPPCLDAADLNDNGLIDLSDPVAALAYLFIGGAPPAPPFPEPGPDPSADDLDCETSLPMP